MSDSSRPPQTVIAAGVLVVLEGLVALAFAVFEVIQLRSSTLGVGAVLPQVGLFVLVAVVLGAIGRGLMRGKFWARTPALVIQILLLPAAWSLLSSSRQPALGVVAGLVALAGIGLLLCGPSRAWSEDLDGARRQG
ncbi:MAG TPA: hypothetical protein VFE65_31980 [Pseudonocardia sp.]|nr:hypothetical protein [Pseudonocardia sp.]